MYKYIFTLLCISDKRSTCDCRRSFFALALVYNATYEHFYIIDEGNIASIIEAIYHFLYNGIVVFRQLTSRRNCFCNFLSSAYRGRHADTHLQAEINTTHTLIRKLDTPQHAHTFINYTTQHTCTRIRKPMHNTKHAYQYEACEKLRLHTILQEK